MRTIPSIFNQIINDIDQAFNDKPFLSMTRDFESIFPVNKYPPTDIIKQDDKFIIKMAVAGFTKDDISVTYDEDRHILTVEGKLVKDEQDEKTNYLQRHIAKREIRSVFPLLKPSLKVKEAVVEHGMLTIVLQDDEIKKEPVKIEVK